MPLATGPGFGEEEQGPGPVAGHGLERWGSWGKDFFFFFIRDAEVRLWAGGRGLVVGEVAAVALPPSVGKTA